MGISQAAIETRSRLHRQGSTAFKRGMPDLRTFEGRYLRAYTASLIKHIGGKPSPVEARIIERCGMLAVHIWRMDQKNSCGMSLHDTRVYLSLNNALVRTLALLRPADGGDGEVKPKTLADIVAEHDSRRGGDGEDVPP
jgi:hypothetical protein